MISFDLDNEILNDVIDSDGKFIPARTTERYLSSKGWREYLNKRYLDNVTDAFIETLFRMRNGIEIVPVCKACGNPVKFSSRYGYSSYCCPKCRNNDDAVKDKNSRGVSLSLKNAYRERGDEIKKKRRITLTNKYNKPNITSSPFSVKEVCDGARKTTLDRYGVENIFMAEHIRKKSKETIIKHSVERWRKRGFDIAYLDDGNILIKNGCRIHGDIIMSHAMFNSRMCNERCHTSTFCPKCRPDYIYSGGELSLKKFLDTLNLKFIMNDRKTIYPQELDFYFPEHNFAIEYNGIYYHSDSMVENDYHLKKYIAAKNKGVNLMFVWENEWLQKPETVKGNIMRVLNIFETIISENDCDVSFIDERDAKEFIRENALRYSEDNTCEYAGLKLRGEICCLISIYSPKNSNYIIFKDFVIGRHLSVNSISSLLKFIYKKYKKDIYLLLINRDNDLKRYFENCGYKCIKNSHPESFCVDVNLMRGNGCCISDDVLNSSTYRCYDCGKQFLYHGGI